MFNVQVVNFYHMKGDFSDPALVYIGRKCKSFPASPLHNPIKVSEQFPRGKAVEEFRRIFTDKANARSFNSEERAELRRIYDLAKSETGVKLMCYCSPRACHGDVLKEYLEKIYEKYGDS